MHCDHCGLNFPARMLDAKPRRLAGPNHTFTELVDALAANEVCDQIECQDCYGPGFTYMPEDIDEARAA